MTSKQVNADRKYSYTSIRLARKAAMILREIAKRNHWTIKQASEKIVYDYAERIDYFNSL